MWCDTVGWVSPSGSVRWHTQASPLRLRLDEAEDPKPRRVREDAERPRERSASAGVERACEQRRAVAGAIVAIVFTTWILTRIYDRARLPI